MHAEFGPASQNLWSYSTRSAEWRDHGVLPSSPPSLSSCSMTSMQEPSNAQAATSTPSSTAAAAAAAPTPSSTTQQKIWLFGGEPHQDGSESYSAQASGLYQLIFDSDGLPVWVPMNLPQAPSSKIGANVGSVGPFMFQYSGSDSGASKEEADSTGSSAGASESSTTGGLHALCTFSEQLVLPKWIDLSQFNNQQGSRARSASAIVGTTVWIHGGEASPAPAVAGDKRRALAPDQNALWSLATSPEAPPPDVACPRGFQRSPPPFGPCIDTGESMCCFEYVGAIVHVWHWYGRYVL
jgi:hypothetical protein